MADKDIELKIKARNETKDDLEKTKNDIKKLGEEGKKANDKISGSGERLQKTYKKNANTIKDINHNIEILKKQYKGAKTGSKEYTSSIKLLRMEQKKLASATGHMGAQSVQQFNRMRIATAGLRRTLGAIRNQILVFLFAWRLMKGTLNIGLEAIQVSKDAEEIQNKFDTVFKEVQDVTNDWAESFADSVGRARQDIKKFSSSLGDVLKPLGFATNESAELSKQVTELALDVASFNNRQDPEVIQAFIRALTGERESLKTLGIVISEADVKQEAYTAGLTKQGDELTKTAKAQATINLLFKNSKDAQGDLARTSESLVNIEKKRNAEYKNMLERWGQKLIPLAKTWNKLLISMYELTKPAVAKLTELQRTMASFEKEEKNLNMMIAQFQNLKINTSKSNEEIAEMNDLMQKLGEAFPAAATFNEFGKVIELDIKRMQRLIELQKESLRLNLMKQLQATFIDFTKDIKNVIDLEDKIKSLKSTIKSYEAEELGLEMFGWDRMSNEQKQYFAWLGPEILRISNKIKTLEGGIRALDDPLNVAVQRIGDMFEVSEKTTASELAAKIGMDFKDNEVYLKKFLDRWKELQNLTTAPAGDGKTAPFIQTKALEDMKKSLKKLYAELGKEQITLGSLDIDEGFERASYIMQEQIATRIEALEEERQQLFDHYADKKDMTDEDVAALEKYNEQITTLEEIKNTKLETLRKKFQDKFEEEYENAQIDIIKDAMERQIALLEQEYTKQQEMWENALENGFMTQKQYDEQIIEEEKNKNYEILKLRSKFADDDLKKMKQYYSMMAEMADANLEYSLKMVEIEATERLMTMIDLRGQELISAQELTDAKLEIMEWETEQKKEILIQQLENEYRLLIEPLEAAWDTALSGISDHIIEDWQITDEYTKSAIKSLGSIVSEWLKEQIKAALISDTLKVAEVAKMGVMGKAIAAKTAVAAANVGTMTFGGASVAAGISYTALLALIRGAAVGGGGGTEAGVISPGLPAARHGMYIGKEQIVHVGEGGEKEVIIPIPKFVPFMLGDYTLPGGFGIEHIPGISSGGNISNISNIYQQSPFIPSLKYMLPRVPRGARKETHPPTLRYGVAGGIPSIQALSQKSPVTGMPDAIPEGTKNIPTEGRKEKATTKIYEKTISIEVHKGISEMIETISKGTKIYNDHFSPQNNKNYISNNTSVQNFGVGELESLMRSNIDAIREMNISLLSQEKYINMSIESSLDMEEFIIKFDKNKKRMTKRGYVE